MAVSLLGCIGVEASRVYAVDYFKNPVNIGIQVTVDGTATYTVEYTLYDVSADDFDPATTAWSPVTGLSALNANASVLFSTPCRGIRLRVSSGTGTVVAAVCQAGIG